MAKQADRLEERILAALNGALAEGRADVAEHLLCALETLCAGKLQGTALDQAYRSLAKPRPVALASKKRQ